MKSDQEYFEEINRKIRRALFEVSPTTPPAITRLSIDEYQIGIDTYNLNLVAYTTIVFSEFGAIVCEVPAYDFRLRTDEQYQIGRVVGKVISSCKCSDTGLSLALSDDTMLLCRREKDFENYSISSAATGLILF